MGRVCILTDSTVQYTRPFFPGDDLIWTIPFNFRAGDKPSGASESPDQDHLTHPSKQSFLDLYSELSQQFGHILVLISSSGLSGSYQAAMEAESIFTGRSRVKVIDTYNTTIGLGLLVQVAAAAANDGVSIQEIDRIVRATIPHIYTLFCIPQLESLAKAGYLTQSQATIGDMLGIYPIFVLEEGRLVPLVKVRTQRHLIESFQEFIAEFIEPRHIALLNSHENPLFKTRPLRQYVSENFSSSPYSEHVIGAHLASMFGTQSLGLVVMERFNGA